MDPEKECSALGGLFQCIMGELKGSSLAFEDLVSKGGKLQQQLKCAVSAVDLFLDALQRVADVATGARGATRDIGTCLTRICMRHRSIENRLKTLSCALSDCLVGPLQEKLDEWRRNALHLEKDHTKEYKRFRGEMKRRSIDTIKLQKLQKKARKGSSTAQRMLASVSKEINDRYSVLLAAERKAVRDALIEQRSQFCLFVSYFKPVVDGELSVLEEVSQLQEVMDLLCKNAADPYQLPLASESVIHDVLGLGEVIGFKTPPSSPGKYTESRKSSLSSLNSLDSSNSRPDPKLLFCVADTSRFSSVCSQDSGFVSQDALFAKRQRNKCLTGPDQLTQRLEESSEAGSSSPVSFGSRKSTPSPSPTVATWPEVPVSLWPSSQTRTVSSPRPHTISAGYSDGKVPFGPRRTPVSAATFVPPRPNSLKVLETKTIHAAHEGSPTNMRLVPDFNQPHTNQVVPQPIYANLNSASVDHKVLNSSHMSTLPRRPLSFVGDDEVTNWLHCGPLTRAPPVRPVECDSVFREPAGFGVLQRRSSASKPPPPTRRTSALSTPTCNDPPRQRSRCSTPVASDYVEWPSHNETGANDLVDNIMTPMRQPWPITPQRSVQGHRELLSDIERGVSLRKLPSQDYSCKL